MPCPTAGHFGRCRGIPIVFERIHGRNTGRALRSFRPPHSLRSRRRRPVSACHDNTDMAPVVPETRRIKTFKSAADFETWLAAHHDTEPEVWIKIHKKSSGLTSVTPAQALDVVLCWGWIDGIRKTFDDKSFLQRYSPRGR